MKQFVFVSRSVANPSSVACKASLQGLLSRSRSSGNLLTVEPDFQNWLHSDCEVEVRVVGDMETLNGYLEKSANSYLYTATVRNSETNEIQAFAIGPYSEGLVRTVVGDISKHVKI